MTDLMHKKNILQKLIQVGSTTLVSRFLGLAREIILMRFLGIGVAADAFNTAFLIPNSLRKIFAEGALTSAFTPTFVGLLHKEGKQKTDELMALAFLVFEGVVLALCILVSCNPEATIGLIAPGFSPDQVAATIPCLRILMPFIFFISSSALLAGALQSVNHFFIPAFCPVLLNIIFIGATLLCLAYGYSVEYLCYAILFAGLIWFMSHLVQYIMVGFSFRMPEATTWRSFRQVLTKFLPCFFSMSVMELSLVIDQRFASYLPVGSVTLIKYTSRFMGIPLGVFAVAFSTILLPHFVRVHIADPKRLNFYLLEAMKFVFWVTIPATIILGFLSKDIFVTLFASSSKNFPQEMVATAGFLLMTFLSGLFFFSINKILFSLYYSFHDTYYPTVIAVIATAVNIGSIYLLVGSLGIVGIAVGTCISGIVQTVLSLLFLKHKHKFVLSMREFFEFAVRYVAQLIALFIPLYGLYRVCYAGVAHLCMTSPAATFFFLKSFGFWFWVGPQILFVFGLLYFTRKAFNVQLYFLD